MNRTQLRHLLTIDNLQKESIYGVIGRMEVLLSYLALNPRYKNLIPFLETYYWVTKKGAEKYLIYRHYFWSKKDYETLDVYFASLYFKPLLLFLEGKTIPSPWQHYFKYCQKNDGIPFLQILLGINSHINSDLYQAVLDLNYQNKSDFFLVNNILKEIVPSVVKLLVREHDLVGLSGLAFQNFIDGEFKNTVVRWREEVWENVQVTNSSHRQINYQKISHNTEVLANQLVDSFTHIYHLQHLPENIRRVNQLSVKLAV